MLRKLLMYVVISAAFLFVYACQDKTGSAGEGDNSGSENGVQTNVSAVCIWDGGSVRGVPQQKGKYLTSMSLGEKVKWTGASAVDSAYRNTKFYEVELSDGKKGWASEYVVAVESKPAVAVQEISLYARPDLLKITNTKFEEMEFMAIVKEEGDWLEVVGKEGKKKGWITKGMVSYEEIDIAVGVLAHKAFAIQDSTQRIGAIEKIIFEPAYYSSRFIPRLKAMAAPEVEETEEYYD